MAKRIRYNFLSGQSNVGTEDAPIYEDFIIVKDTGWSERDEEIAKLESYNGEYEIYDDGDPEDQPTQLDMIEAQVTYTAMMTDTLLEA